MFSTNNKKLFLRPHEGSRLKKLLDFFLERLDLTKQVLKDYLSSGLNMVNFYMSWTLPMNGWHGKVLFM